MGARFVRLFAGALLLVGLPSCGDPPTFAQPAPVASITVSGCSVLGLDDSCEMTAEAIDTEGNVMEDPPLLWRSSSRVILQVDGFGTDATATAVSIGVAEVLVSDATGRIDALPHRIRVTADVE